MQKIEKQFKLSWLKRVHKLGVTYKVVFILILLSLVTTMTEVFGIAMFLPIFQYIRLEGDIDALINNSPVWQYIVDIFAYFNIEISLVILLLISFSFFMARQVFIYLGMVYKKSTRQRVTQTIRNRMFGSYIEADTSYHDSMTTGDLVNVITTEVKDGVTGLLAPMNLIAYAIMLFGYFIILLLLSWQMTLSSIIVLFLASIVANIWIKKSVKTGRKLVDANTLLSEFLVIRLRSPRLVRLSGTEVAEKEEFNKLTQAQRKHAIFGFILKARTDVVIEPIVIGMSFIFLYFSYAVLQLQIEFIGLYLIIVLRLLPTMKGSISQWQLIQGLVGSIEAIESRLKEMHKNVEKDTGVRSIEKLKKTLFIQNVSYCYPGGELDVLKNITIEIKVNTMTAIVGHSGSGKSTLIDLLPRLRLPTSGSIYFDEVNIEEFTLKSLRKMISYVPQSPQIFDVTVKGHILYGKTDATDGDVREAAYLSGAEGFINQMPQGFDTFLGEDGAKISGGQRQRLDLARALLRKSSILILDEPTSNLDVESEEMFNQALARIQKETDTTIIIVSHRLDSIMNADNIVVLNQGMVEAIGTHIELLGKKGWYSRAWNM